MTLSPFWNDDDPDGDPLMVTEVTKPGNGAAVVSPDGEGVVYKPDGGFTGVNCEYTCVIFARCGGTSKKLRTMLLPFCTLSLRSQFGAMPLITLDIAFLSSPPAFEYTACDPSGECDTSNVTVMVDPNNDHPIAFDNREDTAESKSAIVGILENDRLFILVITNVSEPANGACTITEDNHDMYMPDDGLVGRDRCTCEFIGSIVPGNA